MQGPRVGWDINRVFPEGVEGDDLERSLMRGCEHDVGCRTVDMGLEPAGRRHAPPIAGYKPRESILRHWCDQVVAGASLVLEKFGGDDRADRMTPKVLGAGVAAAITKEAGNRVRAAGGERTAEDVDVSGRITHATDLARR